MPTTGGSLGGTDADVEEAGYAGGQGGRLRGGRRARPPLVGAFGRAGGVVGAPGMRPCSAARFLNVASLRAQAACGFRVIGRRGHLLGPGISRDTVITERRSRWSGS